MRRGTEALPVEMTDAERIAAGDALARLLGTIAIERDDAKQVAKENRERIAELEAEASDLAAQVREGARREDVAVEYRPDFDRRVVDVVRLDTGEMVRADPLGDADAQTTLDDVLAGTRDRVAVPS